MKPKLINSAYLLTGYPPGSVPYIYFHNSCSFCTGLLLPTISGIYSDRRQRSLVVGGLTGTRRRVRLPPLSRYVCPLLEIRTSVEGLNSIFYGRLDGLPERVVRLSITVEFMVTRRPTHPTLSQFNVDRPNYGWTLSLCTAIPRMRLALKICGIIEASPQRPGPKDFPNVVVHLNPLPYFPPVLRTSVTQPRGQSWSGSKNHRRLFSKFLHP